MFVMFYALMRVELRLGVTVKCHRLVGLAALPRAQAMDLTSAFAARQATGFSGGGGVYGMGSEHLPEGAVTSGLQLAGMSLQLSNRFSGINEVVGADLTPPSPQLLPPFLIAPAPAHRC